MDVVEAFEALGLEEPDELSAEQLKRSYLRKVRQHSPERDPEGFQRVRQAYELLQGRAGNWQRPASPRAAEPTSFAPPSTTSASEPASAVPAGASASSPEPVVRVEPTESAPLSAPPAAPSTTANDVLPRLRAALDQSKWVAAANALLEMYDDPSLYDQLPPPEIALRISLELFESGKHKTARRLSEAFKAQMVSHGTRLNAETASIWKLLSELSELSRAVDASLTCALAEAIRSGAFQEAAPELRAEMTQYGESKVMALMQSRAPTLFAATWPFARPPALRKKRTFGAITWPVRAGLFGVFALVKLIASMSDAPSHSNTNYAEPAAMSAPHSALDPDDTARLQGLTRDLEQLYSSGNCSGAQALWGDYLQFAHSFRTTEAVRQGYVFRRTQMLNACPASAPELPEEP